MPIDRHSYRLGVGYLLVTCFGWGLNWPAMKHLLLELPPLASRGAAGLAAAALFVALSLATKQSLRVPPGVFPRLAAASMFNVFIWMGFATVALRWLSVAQGALLVYSMPVWATLFAWPLRGERPTLRSLIGLCMCLAGIATLFSGGDFAWNPGRIVGAVLALSAAVVFAFGTVALRPIESMGPFAGLAWQLGLGCLPMLVLSALFEFPLPRSLSSTGWWLMLYMTLVPMGVCYLGWFAALRLLPPATASIATLLTPVIGVSSAAFVIGEPIGIQAIAAMALVLSGVALALRRVTVGEGTP